jgi:glycosyltransferase involved in cell wall biosynthesis
VERLSHGRLAVTAPAATLPRIRGGPALRARDRVAARAPRGRRIAILLPDLGGGGVQAIMLALAAALPEQGHEVDLVVYRAAGELARAIPPAVKLVPLTARIPLVGRLIPVVADPLALPRLLLPVMLAQKPAPTVAHLPALIGYLRRRRPDALLAAAPHQNLEAVWAARLADGPTKVLVSEHTVPSEVLGASRVWRNRFLPPLMRRAYQQAGAIVSVSRELGDDLAAVTGIPRERITAIYNPVVGPQLERLAAEAVDHPWFAPGEPPVVLGVGRLSGQKDFPSLVRAFARVRRRRPARLVIFGNAQGAAKTEERRAELARLAADLGVAEDFDAPGFTGNPFAHMARAALFVLSSRYEGFGNVLPEAMACGCPVVSTNCRAGPSEILDGGRFGPLVPVGDDAALADAMERVLDAPLPAATLKARAQLFSVDRAVRRYLDVLFGDEQPWTVAERVPQLAR